MVKSTGKIQDFCSSEHKTYDVFNGVVVGFGPKVMPGRIATVCIKSVVILNCLQVEQIHKNDTIFTQNDNLGPF